MTEHPIIPGIAKIDYQIARKDGTGNFIDPSQYNSNMSNPPVKTLYDSNMISNKTMSDWGMEAARNAVQIMGTNSYEGIAKNGLTFIFYDQKNGIFRYHPAME